MRSKILLLLPFWVIMVVTLACTRTTSYIEAQNRRAAAEIGANEELAAPVLSAIERYEEDHGHLPAELTSILPTYLSAIPKTVTGEDFRYHVDDMDHYYLCVDVLSKPSVGCCYYGRLESWDCSMKAVH